MLPASSEWKMQNSVPLGRGGTPAAPMDQQGGFGGIFGSFVLPPALLCSLPAPGALCKGKGGIHRDCFPLSLPIWCLAFSPEESARHCSASHSSQSPDVIPWGIQFPNKIQPEHPEGSTGSPWARNGINWDGIKAANHLYPVAKYAQV